MKNKHPLTLMVLALAASGIYGQAQTPAPAPTATGITYAQYQNDVQTMEANADYAKAESDLNDAKAKHDVLVADVKPKIQDANDEIQLRIDAYTTGTAISRADAERALASTLKPFKDAIATNQDAIDAASKDSMAKGIALTNIELQLLPTIDPAMADVVAKGKAFLARVDAAYQPSSHSFPNFKP